MKINFKIGRKGIRITGILLLVFILAGIAGYTLLQRAKSDEDTYIYKETPISFGDLQVGVMESGTIEAEEETQKYELDLVEDSEGDTKSEEDDVDISQYLKFEKVYVAVGQRVNEGDALYKLKDSTVENVRNKLELKAAEAETTLAEAKLSRSLDTLEATHTEATDSLTGVVAETIYGIETAKLNNEVAGYVAAIKESSANIDSLTEEISDTKNEDNGEAYEDCQEALGKYEKADKNNERTFVEIQKNYLEAKEKYDSMMEQIEECEDKIADERETITDYLAKIQDAQINMDVGTLEAKQTYETSALAGTIAQDTYKYTVETAEETVTEAETALEKAQENLEKYESFVGDGTIRAVEKGVVTEVKYEEGDALSSNSDLISYVTDSSLTLQVDVSQEDIANITLGDEVTIVFTAYPDEVYVGEVISVTTTATSEYTAMVSYPVTIKVNGDTSKLYAGMTGDVTFVTEQKAEVLYVSRKAIVEENGKSYVYQKNKKGEIVKTAVETGFTDGVNIEITKGLTKNDSIYIASKVTEESEAKK